MLALVRPKTGSIDSNRLRKKPKNVENNEVTLELNAQRLGGKILELHKVAKSFPTNY